MNKANALIEQMNRVNAEVIKVAESCSAEQWQLPVVEEDGRAVGVVFHHIAVAYPFSLGWAQKIGNNEVLPNLNRKRLNHYNAAHAEEQANTPQAETIALLQKVTEETAVGLQSLSDAQLEKTAANPLVDGKAFSAEWVMQTFAISHAENHLKAIKATIAG